MEALDNNYGDVLSPLKDNMTNKILGFKYVHKLSRQGGNMYSVPNEVRLCFTIEWLLGILSFFQHSSIYYVLFFSWEFFLTP